MPSKKRKAPAGEDSKVAPRKAKTPRASKEVGQGQTLTQAATVTKADAPRQAVFKAAGLLENILLRLPVLSIYSAYRVCVQWKTLISTSKAVKEKLFLIPTAPKKVWELREAELFTAATLSPAPEGTALTELPRGGMAGPPMFLQPVKLHPLLKLDHRLHSPFLDRVHSWRPEQVSATLGRSVRMLALRLNTQSASASPLTDQSPVLDAFITDPPCKLVRVRQTWMLKKRSERGTHHDTLESAVRSDTGITFKDIITSLQQSGRTYFILGGMEVTKFTLEEILQNYQDQEYDIKRRDPEVMIQLSSNIVP